VISAKYCIFGPFNLHLLIFEFYYNLMFCVSSVILVFLQVIKEKLGI
jgi:hypothetical protein